MSINVLWLFLTVPWVGLQCVIEVLPDHTHLLYEIRAWFIKMGKQTIVLVVSLSF